MSVITASRMRESSKCVIWFCLRRSAVAHSAAASEQPELLCHAQLARAQEPGRNGVLIRGQQLVTRTARERARARRVHSPQLECRDLETLLLHLRPRCRLRPLASGDGGGGGGVGVGGGGCGRGIGGTQAGRRGT